MIKGIKASSGVAFGKAYVLKETEIIITKETKLSNIEEIKRFLIAKDESDKQLEALRIKTLEEIGKEESEVFAAHKLLLDDPVMSKEIDDLLNDHAVSCEFAFNEVINKYITMFQSLDNEYMRERASDLKDISKRVLKNLLGISNDDENLSEDVIIVTYDLTPSETVNLDKNFSKGFITEIGGETSHSAIIARTLNIPAVVGIGSEIKRINNGDSIILDGLNGHIIINPNEDEILKYTEMKKTLDEEQSSLMKYLNEESITLDGKHIEIAANIANVTDVENVLEVNADGIGLFRSEFLYMNRSSLPTEDEQYEAYKAVLENMKDKPVIIRTMDIGGDKNLDYLNLEEEMNPFLGYRAIRICLEDTELFKTQLRALLRASIHGNLRIMFPMISCLDELLEAKNILKEVEEELKLKGINFSEKIEVGIMIEIPAAAIMADILATEVDFFSIGTNDLIQYTTAVDRMNAKVAKLYTPYNPAFVRLLNSVIKAGHEHGIYVGMCGNVAGTPEFIPLLLEMGLDEFSMSPNMVLKAKSIVNSFKYTGKLLEKVLKCRTAKEVEDILKTTKA